MFAFGANAGFVGSLPGGKNVHVNDVVGVVPTSDGKGYWMVGSDGGVFAFGDAGFVGSLPNLHVQVSDVVGVVPTASGKGYWMVGKDGGVLPSGTPASWARSRASRCTFRTSWGSCPPGTAAATG